MASFSSESARSSDIMFAVMRASAPCEVSKNILLQAEASSRAQQMEEVHQQLAEVRATLERHLIEAEAARKYLKADALKQKSEELMRQKETLDRCDTSPWPQPSRQSEISAGWGQTFLQM